MRQILEPDARSEAPNIMVDKAGDALIMDFGIARSAGGAKLAAAGSGIGFPAGCGSPRS